MTPTTTPTLKVGSIVVSNDNAGCSGTVVADPCEGYPAPAGFFLINTGTTQSPWYTFGTLTGRTRRKWGYVDCPTVVRFHVETIAKDGVILGVPGNRIPGTWATRPQNVSTGTL
jgi:hypothetical protein